MKTTKLSVAVLAVTAMMMLAALFAPAPSADARAPQEDRPTTTLATKTLGGGNGDASCPDGALGQPGGCYVIVSKILVLTFDYNWMYVCPRGSFEDSLGECRKPVADASPGFGFRIAG